MAGWHGAGLPGGLATQECPTLPVESPVASLQYLSLPQAAVTVTTVLIMSTRGLCAASERPEHRNHPDVLSEPEPPGETRECSGHAPHTAGPLVGRSSIGRKIVPAGRVLGRIYFALSVTQAPRGDPPPPSGASGTIRGAAHSPIVAVEVRAAVASEQLSAIGRRRWRGGG